MTAPKRHQRACDHQLWTKTVGTQTAVETCNEQAAISSDRLTPLTCGQSSRLINERRCASQAVVRINHRQAVNRGSDASVLAVALSCPFSMFGFFVFHGQATDASGSNIQNEHITKGARAAIAV